MLISERHDDTVFEGVFKLNFSNEEYVSSCTESILRQARFGEDSVPSPILTIRIQEEDDVSSVFFEELGEVPGTGVAFAIYEDNARGL